MNDKAIIFNSAFASSEGLWRSQRLLSASALWPKQITPPPPPKLRNIILQSNNQHTVSTVLIPEEGVIHLNLATSAGNTLLDLHNSSHETQPHSTITTYYSLKIFLGFWLAKKTHIIHHNQLLLTKFGRLLQLINQWCQKCSTVAGL